MRLSFEGLFGRGGEAKKSKPETVPSEQPPVRPGAIKDVRDVQAEKFFKQGENLERTAKHLSWQDEGSLAASEPFNAPPEMVRWTKEQKQAWAKEKLQQVEARLEEFILMIYSPAYENDDKKLQAAIAEIDKILDEKRQLELYWDKAEDKNAAGAKTEGKDVPVDKRAAGELFHFGPDPDAAALLENYLRIRDLAVDMWKKIVAAAQDGEINRGLKREWEGEKEQLIKIFEQMPKNLQVELAGPSADNWGRNEDRPRLNQILNRLWGVEDKK